MGSAVMAIEDIKFLYHGSDQYFDKFDLSKSIRTKDFGPGIYMTSNLNQARKWAVRKAYRKRTTYVYKVPFFYQDNLKEKVFLKYDKAWLDFILENRRGNIKESNEYDLIYDRMADGMGTNGKLDIVLPMYSHGDISAEEAIQKLMFQNGYDQYCFKTDRALSQLDEENRTVLVLTKDGNIWTENIEGESA